MYIFFYNSEISLISKTSTTTKTTATTKIIQKEVPVLDLQQKIGQLRPVTVNENKGTATKLSTKSAPSVGDDFKFVKYLAEPDPESKFEFAITAKLEKI